ncbi:arginine permease [Aspergillus karnatakaensis]|uniref:putative amino acid transporter n=1 Tax=Aspergillus karnatakaensis TaxID=1810916 RepID=UPI003CCCB50E
MEISTPSPTSTTSTSTSTNSPSPSKPTPNLDHGADTQLQRTLSTRHLTMIALGSSIGMGLWLGSGTSLRNGGPAALVLGYILAGTMVWSVSHAIGEMAVLYPLPSAFVQWSSMFISPAVGFAVGWAYWFGAWITIANELQGVVTVLRFWPGTAAIPTAAWLTIFWLVIILINAFAVRFFGEVEVVSSTIKFCWIFVVIISLAVVSASGTPSQPPIGFHHWTTTPFRHGFKGFLSVLPTCIFAMSGSETAALVASETQNPRKSVPRAVSSIWLRLALFYILGSLAITITVDPGDPDLFGAGSGGGSGSGRNESPFVLAYRNAGPTVLAHMMNGVIFISVVSTGSVAAYGGSRFLLGLSEVGMAPRIFRLADTQGRPLYSLLLTLSLGGGLSYLNATASGATVFTWFSHLTSLFTLFGWGCICLSHLRMRKAWKIQGRRESELPWRSWAVPWASWWGVVWCGVLLGAEFWLAVWPLDVDLQGEEGMGRVDRVKHFFANYVSVVVIVLVYGGARWWFGGRWWVDLDKVDLDAKRRFYVAGDEEGGSPRKGFVKRVVDAVLR